MTTNDIPRFAWPSGDPAEWIRSWQLLWRGAPETLVQPILPGWTFNINSNNSSSPQTEADVLARHSYGRQLGRISDALAALIVAQHGDEPADRRFADFLKMKREIDEVKEHAAAARVEQIRKDLDLLRAKNPAEYERLRSALAEAFGT
jgi:hypothetical protein